MRHVVRNIAMRPGEKDPEQVCVTVPAFASQAMRRAMLDAFAVAGITGGHLIHDHAAVAIKYGMDRTFTEKPKNIMFFDHGAGGLKVAVVSFHALDTKDKSLRGGPQVLQIRIRAVEYDESIGGLAFDAVVAKLIQARADKTKPGCGNTPTPTPNRR